jgi:glyoxylase-like metal-dependent hydrolase (beta-lactamase superfamily II)
MEWCVKALFEIDPKLESVYRVEDAGGCSCVYVLEGGRTIVDAGNMYGLIDELQELGPPDRLERILLTHSHFDHVGGIEEIYQVSSPDLYVHPFARECLRCHPHPFPEFFEALEKDGKIKIMKDGEVIQGSPILTAFHTPGHTGGDLCFFDPHSGALFSGDTILPHGHRFGSELSRPDEVCGGRAGDRLHSLRRLLALDVCHLLPGHGEPVFHRGRDEIKISLYTVHRSLNESHPERAWIGMGEDLLRAGLMEDAAQCAAKAYELGPDVVEVREFQRRVTGANAVELST